MSSIKKIEIGDFSVVEIPDNILDTRLFGIPVILIGIIGVVIYLIKK